MKIGGYVKNSFVDYPGKISFVVFTNGCNLRCWYCHNSHLFQNRDFVDEDFIFNFLKTHKTFIDAVVISGGEPTLQADLKEFILKVKKLGFLIKLDTNGTNFDVLKALIEDKLIDYVAMDIKAPLEKYDKIVKVHFDKDSIKKSIEFLKQNKVSYEFRTTFSPDLNLDDIEKICEQIKGAETFSLQKYNRVSLNEFNKECADDLYLEPHKKEFFLKALEIAQQYIKKVNLKY